MKAIKFIILILVSVVLIAACKRDPEIPAPSRYVLLSQELKDWTYFKPGSYWILRDSLTGQEDSVYVLSETPAWNVLHKKDSMIFYEEIKIRFSSNRYLNEYIISCFSGKQAKYDYQLIIFDLDTAALVKKEGAGIIENRSIKNFNESGVNYGPVRFIYFYYLYVRPSSPQALLKNFLYWKKHVGLVKKVNFPGFNGGYSKQVIRYKVIQ